MYLGEISLIIVNEEVKHMKNSHSALGVLLLVIGSVMLLNNTNVLAFNMELMWPLFMIIPGVVFHMSYFNGKNRHNPTVLVPGAILTIYGLYFLFSIITNWQFSDILWPIFPMGVGVGFYEMYYFGGNRKAHMTTAIILCGFSFFALIMELFNLNFNYLFPMLLIVAGLVIVYQSSVRTKELEEEEDRANSDNRIGDDDQPL